MKQVNKVHTCNIYVLPYKKKLVLNLWSTICFAHKAGYNLSKNFNHNVMYICPDWLMPGCKEKPNWLFDGQMLSTAIKGNSFSELLNIFIHCTIIKDTSIVSYIPFFVLM